MYSYYLHQPINRPCRGEPQRWHRFIPKAPWRTATKACASTGVWLGDGAAPTAWPSPRATGIQLVVWNSPRYLRLVTTWDTITFGDSQLCMCVCVCVTCVISQESSAHVHIKTQKHQKQCVLIVLMRLMHYVPMRRFIFFLERSFSQSTNTLVRFIENTTCY